MVMLVNPSQQWRIMVSITSQDVENALDEIDKNGVPSRRRSTGYCLLIRDRHYPPKHVLYVAYRILHNGEKWPNLKGGKFVRDWFTKRGFTIEKDECRNVNLKVID
jgi:hypothetical protein